MNKLNVLVLLAAGLASGISSAQSGAGQAPQYVITPSPATSQYLSEIELRPQTKNDVAYLCGGIGSGEAEKIKAAASKYDLMMTFAASNGAYLADVNVDIANSKGESVFSEKCDGPILLVDLPKGGKYKLTAEVAGSTLTRSARLSEKGPVKRITMTWPTKVVDMGLTPNRDAGSSVENMRSSGGGMSPESGSSGSGAR